MTHPATQVPNTPENAPESYPSASNHPSVVIRSRAMELAVRFAEWHASTDTTADDLVQIATTIENYLAGNA